MSPDAVRTALERLVAKLDLIARDPQFQSMAVVNFIHGIEYTGPNWAQELAEAHAALAAPSTFKDYGVYAPDVERDLSLNYTNKDESRSPDGDGHGTRQPGIVEPKTHREPSTASLRSDSIAGSEPADSHQSSTPSVPLADLEALSQQWKMPPLHQPRVLAKLPCPYCGSEQSKVINSRAGVRHDGIWRRRECLTCAKRFTTEETIRGHYSAK